MAIKARTFYTASCDVCGSDDTDDVIPLFDTPNAAADDARTCRWLITADHQAICPTQDDQHRAALDDLLPPEPDIEIGGQLRLDLDTRD
ncbi:hypothetical protein [Kitasatospora indigofera]|uniref:hypothetical protein n=1 Tax=Kitasatospora indigofera TaxID=67307 RepID=UPI0036C1C8B5